MKLLLSLLLLLLLMLITTTLMRLSVADGSGRRLAAANRRRCRCYRGRVSDLGRVTSRPSRSASCTGCPTRRRPRPSGTSSARPTTWSAPGPTPAAGPSDRVRAEICGDLAAAAAAASRCPTRLRSTGSPSTTSLHANSR